MNHALLRNPLFLLLISAISGCAATSSPPASDVGVAQLALTGDLPGVSYLTLSIYDASGRLVATLVDRERQESGQHAGIWPGLDSRGRAVPSGVYFSMLTAGKERLSKKMILLR